MSINTVSSNYSAYQTATPQQQRRFALDTLAHALQAGDLRGAQRAFGQLQQDRSNTAGNAPAQATGTRKDAMIADISLLGKSLAANDLETAQKAFTALRHDAKLASLPPPRPAAADTQSGANTANGIDVTA